VVGAVVTAVVGATVVLAAVGAVGVVEALVVGLVDGLLVPVELPHPDAMMTRAATNPALGLEAFAYPGVHGGSIMRGPRGPFPLRET
jgi:hypothetical protein